MNSHDQVPVVIRHILEADIPQDPCIVDENVDAAIGMDCCFDDLLTLDNIVVVGDCLSTGRIDLGHDFVGKL